ncbi:MAG: alkaline phosphatase family protein, partial [Deltaproteobacteria bacterium]|nr:alkaline phosphatase family protein [Deltaproteobacteria bacterium]
MLAVIGLDGASPHIIAENLSKLPTFKRLLNDFNSTVLYCDVTLHSAPIWITVFTGVSDKVHGIKSFHNGERLYTRQDLKFPLLWETLAEKGYKAIAFNVPCFMPPICFGCRYEMHLPAILSLSEKEILGSNRYYLRRSLRLIRKNPDFFATVFPSLDRAQHLFWGNQRKILYYYKEIDKTLAK